MTCCGRRRATLTAASAQARLRAPLPPPPPAPPAPAAMPAETALRYLGTAPLSLRGPRSGRVYRMAHRGEHISVATADAAALLATRLFARG